MSTEVVTAVIAAVVSVVGAIISLYGQIRITRIQHQQVQERESRAKLAKTAEVVAKYRDPILRTALDFQRRMYDIKYGNFLRKRYGHSQAEWDYAVHNTLYIIAEYLGWVEILRREVQFLDLGNVDMSRRLQRLLDKIAQSLYRDGAELPFHLHRGEQRAIGEIMLSTIQAKEEIKHVCIGYATFVKRLNDPEFSYWFTKLKTDIEKVARDSQANEDRLVILRESLLDLIEFLDPDGVRWPKDEWHKFVAER